MTVGEPYDEHVDMVVSGPGPIYVPAPTRGEPPPRRIFEPPPRDVDPESYRRGWDEAIEQASRNLRVALLKADGEVCAADVTRFEFAVTRLMGRAQP